MGIQNKVLAATLSAALLLSGAGCTFAPEDRKHGGGELPVITIDPESRGFAFSDGLYGTNHRFFSYGCGTWDHENQSIDKDFDALYARSGLRAIRYPGGTCANYFWWKNSIGPVEQRAPNVNAYRGNGGEVTELGLHEFLDFAQRHGQTVIWVYNAANGSAQDAAELVYYLNGRVDSEDATEAYWAGLRARNGHEVPYHVRFFELGNEFGFQSSCFSAGKGTGEGEGKSKDELYATGAELAFTQTPVGVYGDFSTAASKSDGSPNQVKMIPYGPASGEVRVFTGEATGSQSAFIPDNDVWTQVTREEMAARGPDERVYWVEDGLYIHFGDGVHGAVPAQGKSVASSYSSWHDGVRQYAEAMKEAARVCGVDIRVYACLESEAFMKAAADTHYDGIAVHPYVTSDVCGQVRPLGDWTEDLNTWHNNSMLAFDLSTALCKRIQTQLDAHPGAEDRQRDIIVTEFTNHSASGLYYGSMSNTALTMSQLFDFFDMDLAFALRHSTVDDFFGGSTRAMALYDGGPVDIYEGTRTGQFLAEPAAYAYMLLDHMTGQYHLDSEIANMPRLQLKPEEAVEITSGLTTDGQADLLRTLASVDEDGNIYLIVLNRSCDTDYTVEVNVPGYAISQADVEILWHEDIAAVNTYEAPETVTITPDTVSVNGESFAYTLPYCSMVGFRLEKAENHH